MNGSPPRRLERNQIMNSPIGRRTLLGHTALAIGGGLASSLAPVGAEIAMARAGARVLGVDLSQACLDVARLHALEARVELDYRAVSAEALAHECLAAPAAPLRRAGVRVLTPVIAARVDGVPRRVRPDRGERELAGRERVQGTDLSRRGVRRP